MHNLELAFTNYHGFEKVKTRILPTTLEYTTNLKLDSQANTLATLIAMLRRGEEECTNEKPFEPDLFEKQKEEPTFPGTPSGNGDGVVKGSKPQDSENGSDENADPTTKADEEKEVDHPKKPNAFKRFWNRLTDVAGTLVEEN